MIELYLSSDGKHTIHAQSETPEQMDKLLPYAKTLYKDIIKELGTKAEMWSGAFNGKGNHKLSSQDQHEITPLCLIHNKPLTKRVGKYGDFWSCGTHLDDGSWCKYRYSKDKLADKVSNGERRPVNGQLL